MFHVPCIHKMYKIHDSQLWSGLHILYFYYCSYHPEDGHVSGRNMSVVIM